MHVCIPDSKAFSIILYYLMVQYRVRWDTIGTAFNGENAVCTEIIIFVYKIFLNRAFK